MTNTQTAIDLEKQIDEFHTGCIKGATQSTDS